MNWYKGDIAQAVAESRAKNAVFVVYIAGKDANTEKLTTMLNETKIRSKLESNQFVAIRVESDSQSYIQFASIYQVVPVPSIFFIGKSGAPIEIGTSIMKDADELNEKIERALGSQQSSTLSFIAAEKESAATENQPQKDSTDPVTSSNSNSVSQPQTQDGMQVEEEIVCEDSVCFKKPKEPTDSAASKQNDDSNPPPEEVEVNAADSSDLNARLEATRRILQQKRIERIEEEKKLEKEQELRRRREGKEMQHLQEWQREQELKELKANIRRERLAAQEDRERIKAQIAADRVERAQKFNVATPDTTTPKEPIVKQPINPDTVTENVRLQFRLSNRDAESHTFNIRDTFGTVREYVRSKLLTEARAKFTLATSYPRHEFTAEDDLKTLLDLGLFPSAVILVITKEGSKPAELIARSGGVINIVSTLFWTLFSPVFAVFNYFRNTITGTRNNANVAETGAQKRANEDSPSHNDASKRRNLDRFMTGPSTSKQAALQKEKNEQDNEQKPYRRYGSPNVHRLSDRRKDSDDENATWNGNSTQQQ